MIRKEAFVNALKSQHETVFALFLCVLAVLFRNHTAISYPDILYVFAVFLGFNLLFNFFLKQKKPSPWLQCADVLINGVLITWAISCSGGEGSYLWVMYLLPVFTSCLLYDRRTVWLAAAYIILLQAFVYRESLWNLDGPGALQLASRIGLLALSASITARLAFAERKARDAILQQRQELEEALKKARIEPEPGGDDADALLRRGVHDLNTALMVIMGSTQLVAAQTEEDWFGRVDLGRVESAARISKLILQNLALLHRPGGQTEDASLRELLQEALEQGRGELRARQVSVQTDWQARQDRGAWDRHRMRQALVNILFYAAQATPPGGVVRLTSRNLTNGSVPQVSVIVEDGGTGVPDADITKFFDARAVLPGLGKGVALALQMAQGIIVRHGGALAAQPIPTGGIRLTLNLPCLDGSVVPSSDRR